MCLKLFQSVKIFLVLFALTILMASCQSMPTTSDQTSVIQNIIAHDEDLSTITPNKLQSSDDKLAQQNLLSEKDAVLFALNNNASFKALLIDLKLAKADLVNAGLLPNPELLYVFGVINKPYKYAIDFPIEALWLRPIRLRTMKHEAHAVTYRLTQSGLNLIRDTRIAYAQTVLAQERVKVLEASYLLRQRISDLSIKRLAAGDINGKDILIAKNDASMAKRDWEISHYDAQLKIEALINLLGTSKKLTNIQLSPAVIPACQVLDIDTLLTQSLEQRPDIMAAQFSTNAAKEKIKLSKVGWFKFIGTADASSGQPDGRTLGPSIRATIPAFNQNQGGISRAEAELERAELNLEALRQQAALEIKSTHLQYQQSCHDWNVLNEDLMPAIQQTNQLTQQAYAEGDISYLQTLEANRQLIDAQMRQVQLKAELVGKWAELMRNFGKKLHGE